MLSVRLPEDIERRLTALAETTGRPKSFYVREAILNRLDEMEDIYLAEKRLEDIRAGRARTVSLAEALSELDLTDPDPVKRDRSARGLDD